MLLVHPQGMDPVRATTANPGVHPELGPTMLSIDGSSKGVAGTASSVDTQLVSLLWLTKNLW